MKIFLVYDQIKNKIPIGNTEKIHSCACKRYIEYNDIQCETISIDQISTYKTNESLFLYPMNFSSLEFDNTNRRLSQRTRAILSKNRIPIFGIDFIDPNFIHNMGHLNVTVNPYPELDMYLFTSNLKLDASRFRIFKKIYEVDYWESTTRNLIDFFIPDWPRRVSISEIDFYAKTKDFLCMNRNLRSHRLALLSEFDRLNLFENTNYSAIIPNTDIPEAEKYQDHTIQNARSIIGSDGQKHFSTFLKNLKPHFIESEDPKLVGPRYAKAEVYNETFFSLVTETEVRKDILFISEKPFLSMYFYHPFMIYGSVGTLAWLRSQGYETFPELFDESYDTEEDPGKKLKMIIAEVQKFKSLTLIEKQKLIIDVKPKLLYNHNLFRDRPNIFKNQIENIFTELYDRQQDN